jgi:hypothetical protein
MQHNLGRNLSIQYLGEFETEFENIFMDVILALRGLSMDEITVGRKFRFSVSFTRKHGNKFFHDLCFLYRDTISSAIFY